MITFVEIVPASESLLPPLCRECLWWQRVHNLPTTEGGALKSDWLERVSRKWGSCGMAAVQGSDTLGTIQFAPVRSLSRALHLLPEVPSPDSALMFCLRLKKGRPFEEARPLLHRALSSLHQRGTAEVLAFARAMGSARTYGAGNVFGLEFLLANGFQPVGRAGRLRVLRCDLRGLLPMISDLLWVWRWMRHDAPTLTPV
ncbi:MAG: hypothetical protein GX604_03985 [Actinobacteria bacterium]|nr:hypothetical protein [Actinomycetota bacterium]